MQNSTTILGIIEMRLKGISYDDCRNRYGVGSYLKPLLVQVANAVVTSDKYPECKERYRRIKAHRGHKKAIIAICRMLLTAIWHILSKGEPYCAEGYSSDIPAAENKVLTTMQALNLLKSRGFTIRDDSSPDTT